MGRMKNKEILKTEWGSVRPYTRHATDCPHRRKKDHNECRCAKWAYVNPRGGTPRRYTLTTPSWPEALKRATYILDGLNPEIARAREKEEKEERERKTVAAACKVWLDKTEAQSGRGGSWAVYQSISNKVKEWALREGIENIQDITPQHLLAWQMSRDWKKYAPLTRQQRWNSLRSMFSVLRDLGVIETNPIAAVKAVRAEDDHVQGPYTDAQTKAIFSSIEASAETIAEKDREVYVARLRAFMLLLLHSGCDLVDAVLFDQSKLTDAKVGRKVVSVLRYRRQKTRRKAKVPPAVIPLPTDVAGAIRVVPMLQGNPAGMPFRTKVDLESDTAVWSQRIARVLAAAGVEYVALPGLDSEGRPRRKEANAKMFRHTAAVRWLVGGHQPEQVARMMGHADTQMVRKHYAPWVEDLDAAHVRAVVETMAGKRR